MYTMSPNQNTKPICSVTQSCLTIQPHGLQHTRLPCPSPSPRVCPSSCPLSRWCHPTISSSVPILLLPSIFLRIRIFSNELALRSGGQSIGASASAPVLPMNIQDWFPLGFTPLQSRGLSRVFYNTTSSKASVLWHSAFFIVQLSNPYMTTRKTMVLTRWTTKLLLCWQSNISAF